MADITLTKIIPTDTQIATLYDVLAKRSHGISHEEMPSFKAHTEFVKTHPYRAWYMVDQGGECLGAVYVQNDNSIGINIDASQYASIADILKQIKHLIPPLPPIKSVRNGRYHVHVAAQNTALIQALKDMKATPVQVTFLLED
ncbi:MAG: hypothetical protein ACPGVK_08205 [Halocynthiibacter sp.]